MPFAPDALQRHNIETKISQALEKVKQLLGAEKSPQIAGDVHHDYEDKYLLVERATNMAAAAELNCFGMLGLTPQQLSTLKQWTSGQEVSLRFKAKEQCNFLREETREEEAPRKHVEEVSVGGVLRSAITSKVVTKITEYFWNFETNYVLEAFKGVGAEEADRMVIWSRQGQVELKTSAKSPAPHPEVRSPAVNKEVNISWLLRTLSDPATPTFSIDRTVKSCKTPRRNQDFDKAYAHFMALSNWTMYVADYINHLRTVQPRKIDDSALSLEHIFVPITPIMFKEGIGEINDTSAKAPLMSALGGDAAEPSLVMSASAGNVLLAEQMRSLKEQHQNILTCFPGDAGILTSAEACMSLTLTHLNSVAHRWVQAADYVESMLRQQLVAAIGKEVSPSEFGSYMRFHYRKLFLDAYQPSQFSFAVRRTEQHGPEGTVSIEEESYGETGASMHTPIVTLKNHGSTPTAISFPLSASTTVSFTGPVHLHGFLRHSFSGQTGSGLFLKSRARQFSSMLVLVGRVTSATSFDPTYAAIIQNKDELTIPLEMSVIPTPKEFKDAIASLSPEQQQFAKAFRAMQLESTLFGVVVVQIKPQLEKLLNLPDDSLTKEIKLTQDLMELFLKYQIPSDLLSFSEPEGATETTSAPARLQTVKGHVKAMLDMIQKEKEAEIEERKKEAQFAQPLIEFDQFGSADMMCLGAAPCGAAPFGGAPFGGIMVSDHCEAMNQSMEVDFGRAPEKKSKGRQAMRGRAAPAAPSCPVPAPPAAASATPAATPAPPGSTPPPQKETQHQPDKVEAMGPGSSASVGVSRDYTQVPQQMDEQFEKMDPDSSLRPTIINVGKQWKKRSQKALLAQPTEANLAAEEQKSEKDAAFDLLDAITKSGALPLSHATLRIVIAATHCFDKTVLETVVQENVNPIDKVERSTLIMASTVHQQPTAALINQSSFSRVSAASPQLFLKDAD